MTTQMPGAAGSDRVRLVPVEEWDAELLSFVQRAVQSDGEPLNFFKAMVHHPKLLEKWTVFAARLLGKGILEPRVRELIVLRTVHNCGATYEWVHHAAIAQENGLTDAEVRAVAEGPDSPAWSPRERSLLQAVDELHRDSVIADATFAALARTFDPAELVEIVLLVGNYHLVSYFVRSFAVPLEPGVAAPGPG